MAQSASAERPNPSRRSVLRRLGVGVGTLVAATGTAAAQQEVMTSRAVIPEQDQFQPSNLPGFFLHVDPQADAIRAQVSDECEYATWPPSRSRAYDATLIDRKDDDHRSIMTTVYVAARRSIDPGSLFVVNNVQDCGGAYVGIELELIRGTLGGGPGAAPVRTAADVGDTPEDGPGFGVAAGVAGLLGLGALSRLRSRLHGGEGED